MNYNIIFNNIHAPKPMMSGRNFNVEQFNNNFSNKQQQNQQTDLNRMAPQRNPNIDYNNFNVNQDSNNRAACLIVVDKHRKKYVSVFTDNTSFDIPGGKAKIIEPFDECARREMWEETGLVVETRNMEQILDAFDGKVKVVTYVAFLYKGKLETKENHYVSWVPLEYLKINKNPRWQKYNTIVYEKILGKIY